MPQTYESTITYGGLALPLDWDKIPLNIPNAAYFARNSVGRPPWSAPVPLDPLFAPPN